VYNSINFSQAKHHVGFLTFFATISAGKKLCFAPSEGGQPSYKSDPAASYLHQKMSTTIQTAVPFHPYANIYQTDKGEVTVHPEISAGNPYGFILVANSAAIGTPRRAAANSVASALWTFVTNLLTTTLFYARYLSIVKWNPFQQVVPAIIRHHLIIVTPPPSLIFPIRHFRPDHARLWFSPTATMSAIQYRCNNGIPEVYIFHHAPSLVGSQKIKAGDLIFVCEIGFYITAEIGPLPYWPG
jgi:hypothetical protein